MKNVIEVTDLAKRYGDRTVVDGISFTVQRGEIAKLDVNDRAAAVATAFERGLLSPKRSDRR